ncbi:hypothetical protein SVXHr_2682 [Halorhabdus sp. SVX81]|uniref:hypothetical protein n=1 Tax=Halorhabdus sp. SVX81 TaxID=2978283 RepID=UPI0023DC038F|nr:hypothetical protein [Halorhabdus sp. SVX81]WEL18826.1 hypothetical protein SVXHr_2682 [Halorhabdus sp. SVX81]
MNRRHVLGSLPAVGSLALAGCSSILGSGDKGTVLGKITVMNSSRVPNRVRVVVERDGETLVTEDVSLGALDSEDDSDWTMIDPSWSHTQSQYTVRAAHIDESGDLEAEYREYTFSQEDYATYYEDRQADPGCLGAEVRVGSLSEDPNARISVSPTKVENPCGNGDSR